VVAGVQSQARSSGICGGQSINGDRLFSEYFCCFHSVSIHQSSSLFRHRLSLSQELTSSLIRHENQWGKELPYVVHAWEWMGKYRNADPHVSQIEASGNNDGTGWSWTWRLDNVFDIVTRFRARRLIGSIPDGGRKRFSSPACPDWISVPANLLFSGYQGAHSSGVMRPGCETYRFPLSSVEVKNGVVHPPHSCIVHRDDLFVCLFPWASAASHGCNSA
jgi:hypothetical protein